MTARARFLICAAVNASVLIGGLAVAGQPADAWTTAKIKMALLAEDGVDGFDVNVDTFNGIATVHGMVENDAERTRVELTAQEVDGVRGVRNALAVVPEAERKAVMLRDKHLASVIDEAIERDPSLSASRISILSVNDGIVVLGGRADSASAHRQAIHVAREVDGVRQVTSEIRSPDVLRDAEIWEATGAVSTPPDSGFRKIASDMWITTRATVKLLTSYGLSPTSVDVETRAGIVTLSGVVESEFIKEAAELTVMDIAGVRHVVNSLQVVPIADTAQMREKDGRIFQTVSAEIQARDGIDASDVDVNVTNGVIRLRGVVPNEQDRLALLALAWETDGAQFVIDDLMVEPSDESRVVYQTRPGRPGRPVIIRITRKPQGAE